MGEWAKRREKISVKTKRSTTPSWIKFVEDRREKIKINRQVKINSWKISWTKIKRIKEEIEKVKVKVKSKKNSKRSLRHQPRKAMYQSNSTILRLKSTIWVKLIEYLRKGKSNWRLWSKLHQHRHRYQWPLKPFRMSKRQHILIWKRRQYKNNKWNNLFKDNWSRVVPTIQPIHHHKPWLQTWFQTRRIRPRVH